MESKKVQMVMFGILGTLVVLLIKGFFPDLPDGVIEWAIGVIGGVPALGATGQALADGMSKGLTSSNFKADTTTTFKDVLAPKTDPASLQAG